MGLPSQEESEQALILLRRLSRHKGETITYFTSFWRETFDIRRVIPISIPPDSEGNIGPIVIIRVKDAINDLKGRYHFYTTDELETTLKTLTTE